MHCILVAEDNKANQIVVAGTLKKLGYAVDIVESGGAAVEACFTNVYAAVLMDVMMPGMDGYEATAKIRQHESIGDLEPVPIIGLSARAMTGDREIAIEAGMNDYLTKPLRAAALDEALVRWITTPVVAI
jgi:CheY-like chemotaxis protein